MIDIGANLTHHSFCDDLDTVLSDAWKAELSAIIVTGCSLADSHDAMKLATRDPRLYFTCGIHPHMAKDHLSFDQAAYQTLLQHPRCVAIGECGLDNHRDFSSPEQQKQVFAQQLEIAHASSLPLFLHQRNALDDFLMMIKESGITNKFVTHCFTDGPKELKRLLDAGSYIGVTGWLCDQRRNHALLEALAYIPLDRLLIETDAPYLMPAADSNKTMRNEPKNLPIVAERIASLLGSTTEALVEQTTKNTYALFDKITP